MNPVPWGRLVERVLLVFKELRAPLVRVVTPDPRALSDLLDRQDHRVQLVRLVYEARKALREKMVLLARRVLRVRPENLTRPSRASSGVQGATAS